VPERLSQRTKTARAQVEAAFRMQNPHVHHGTWVTAIVAFSGLINIEMNKHSTAPLPFAEDIFDISDSRST